MLKSQDTNLTLKILRNLNYQLIALILQINFNILFFIRHNSYYVSVNNYNSLPIRKGIIISLYKSLFLITFTIRNVIIQAQARVRRRRQLVRRRRCCVCERYRYPFIINITCCYNVTIWNWDDVRVIILIFIFLIVILIMTFMILYASNFGPR